MPLVSPRVDFAFKKLFGVEENKDILISLINAVVSDADQVSDIILLNPYNHKEHQLERLSILDIKATAKMGKHYNIEMQVSEQVYYSQRALYYWSKLYTSQLESGDPFSKLQKTISINLLNFNALNEEAAYHNVFKILNVTSYRSFQEHLELHFIELNKCDDDLTHIKTALDRWVNFLKKAEHYDNTTFPQILKEEPTIEKAFQKLNILSFDDNEREIYDARVKWMRDEAGTIQTAELKGRAEGEQIGIVKGEQQAKYYSAKQMLQDGMTIEQVAKYTNLSIDKIEEIKKEMTSW